MLAILIQAQWPNDSCTYVSFMFSEQIEEFEYSLCTWPTISPFKTTATAYLPCGFFVGGFFLGGGGCLFVWVLFFGGVVFTFLYFAN